MRELDSEDEVSKMSADKLRALLATDRKKLRLLEEIASAQSSSLNLDQLLTRIMENIRELMSADRATLFLISDDGQQLWSKVLDGGTEQEIRLEIGEGIAGWVAVSGEVVNIADAYIDTRFQPAVDVRSGYRTKSILCVQMRGTAGEPMGVLQLLNKSGGPFTRKDEELLSSLAGQAAISIENARLYHSVVAKNLALLEAQDTLQARTNELNVLYDIEREMAEAIDLDSLLPKLLHRAMNVVESGAGCIALVEKNGQETRLRFRTTSGSTLSNLRHTTIGLNHGVIGWSASNHESVIVNAPSEDDRYVADENAEVRNLLCAPLSDGEEVLGAIELVDKVDRSPYEEEDMRMLILIAGQASRAIQLHRAKEQALNDNRLASIGQMVAGILHDLKTPMTIISGYAQLMAQSADADQREKYVEQILQQFEFLGGMTREVLAFARGESTVLIRKVFLHKYMESVREQLNHSLSGRNIKLEIDAQYEGVGYFDEQSLLRLVHNLARNAVDAMKGRAGIFRISTQVDNESLYFAFSDNGPGIPTQLEGRLFDMFASATQGGSGLGLAICKKIAGDHNGSISYESKLGEGTTFTLRLPLNPSAR